MNKKIKNQSWNPIIIPKLILLMFGRNAPSKEKTLN